MPSSNTLTFDQTTPHRPALSELGGGAKENDVKYPPNPAKHPTAEDFNQFSKLLEALGKMTPLARLWVTINAGTPSVSIVQAPGSAVDASDFNVVDNGAGDTTIWWTTGSGGSLPAAAGVGALTQTDDVEIDRIRAQLTTHSGNPAVRVKTKLGASGTDANFMVEIC
jgi:hypothetical protein